MILTNVVYSKLSPLHIYVCKVPFTSYEIQIKAHILGRTSRAHSGVTVTVDLSECNWNLYLREREVQRINLLMKRKSKIKRCSFQDPNHIISHQSLFIDHRIYYYR